MSETPPLLDTALDLTALAFIGALLLLSLLSLSFVILLRFKSRNAVVVVKPLHDFNSLWTVRLLLASLVSLWSLSQLLRRRPRRPSLCQIHVVLSLGLLQPAILLTILLLVNACVQTHRTALVTVSLVLAACVPVLALQALSVFFDFSTIPFLLFQNQSFFVYSGGHPTGSGGICTYPPLSVLIFAVFGAGFLVLFLLSCYRVVSVVINKGLRARIYVLALAILASLVNQIIFLGVSALRNPGDAAHQVAAFVVFLSALSCAVVGEGILVISPIADSLSAVEECHQVCSDSQCLQESDRGASPAAWW